MNKRNIFDLTLGELERELTPSFRARQVYQWLYKMYESNFDLMINVPKNLRSKLDANFSASNLEIKHISVSEDKTKKYLYETIDKHSFESVLLKMKESVYDEHNKQISQEKYTICVSSQVGCKMGCSFCFTSKIPFGRNLSAGEIVEQIVSIKRDNAIPPQKSLNIVYMGMGEPLDNFENVVKAIKIISSLDGLSIATRRQTISTSGISPKIDLLGELNLGVQLAISLHAVNDEVRDKLMPLNKIYNIENIIGAVRRFPLESRKRVMFEYLMIKEVNDDLSCARELLRLLNGIKSKVNLILFNPHEGSKFQRPDLETAQRFRDYLNSKGLLCTIRESRGIDIEAACGQLQEKHAVR